MKRISTKIKFFVNTAVKSLTKFSYYKEITKTKFNFSLKYLFFLFYVLSLLTSIVFGVSITALVIPNIPKFISVVENKAASFYPVGLEVLVKDGKVSTNQKEPYAVDSLNSLGINKGFDHLLVIDTKADPGNIKNENTMVLVTKDSIVTMDNANSYKVYQIDPGTSVDITQDSYNKLLSQVTPFLKYIQPGLIILVALLIVIWPVIGAGLSLIGELIYLAVFTLIVFVLVKIMKKDITYKKLYQLCMHAATLPILLTFIVGSLGIQMPFLLGSAILFVFMILVLNQL